MCSSIISYSILFYNHTNSLHQSDYTHSNNLRQSDYTPSKSLLQSGYLYTQTNSLLETNYLDYYIHPNNCFLVLNTK